MAPAELAAGLLAAGAEHHRQAGDDVLRAVFDVADTADEAACGRASVYHGRMRLRYRSFTSCRRDIAVVDIEGQGRIDQITKTGDRLVPELATCCRWAWGGEGNGVTVRACCGTATAETTIHIYPTEPTADMRGNRPAKREVIDHVSHDRVGVSAPVRCHESATVRPYGRRGVRYIVIPVAVFPLEAPRAPHVAGADAGVEAAVEIDLPF